MERTAKRYSSLQCIRNTRENSIAIDILTVKLQISHDCIYSQTHPAGTIQRDNAFRIGKKLGEKLRPLVVVFSTQS